MAVGARLLLTLYVVPGLLVPALEAAEVLGLFQSPGRSQWVLAETYLRALERRGHRITAVTTFPSSQGSTGGNWTEILIPNPINEHGDLNAFEEVGTGVLDVMKQFLEFSEKTCHGFLKDKNVQKLHKSGKKFDVIVLENLFTECVHGYAHGLKAPVIVLSTFGGTDWMADMVGNPTPYSYVANPFLELGTHMGFLERLQNTLVGVGGKIVRQFLYLPRLDSILQTYLKDPSLPSLSEIERQTSLLLVNYHFTHGCPRPLVPSMVEVGGLHVRQPKKLPQDIQKFLDEATDGAIFFSMGSNVQSAHWPEEKRSAFLKVFSRLKQRVLWKWEKDSMPGQPPNVKTGKWLPQSDILAHKNVRVFITHGGLLSTQEATARGVPLVGIPVFGDQLLNMAQAQRQGYAITLAISNITEASLSWALNEVLNIPRYRGNARRLSRIFHDRPVKPLDQAVYWTEYVIRHQGAPHLRSAALDLAWYQYLLLDVVTMLVAAALLALLVTRAAFRAVLRLLKGTAGGFKPKRTSTKSNKRD
ncbi:UDP-glycosyltransferase UGT5-like isoform X3 [Schistocerca serialis cubense]|uniref:UDP-glycosyltransferase UGT5-like isoform X3 n=1 Tax=Schistocerca serialis cubense TaxID=2023355 RepID=UPI00214E610B|nr:UDP-glycosyltransferase UGT5-like isoform X3 [Schistocerca serialis cubense]